MRAPPAPGFPFLLLESDWGQQTQNTPVTGIGCTCLLSSLHHLDCCYARVPGSGKCTASDVAKDAQSLQLVPTSFEFLQHSESVHSVLYHVLIALYTSLAFPVALKFLCSTDWVLHCLILLKNNIPTANSAHKQIICVYIPFVFEHCELVVLFSILVLLFYQRPNNSSLNEIDIYFSHSKDLDWQAIQGCRQIYPYLAALSCP